MRRKLLFLILILLAPAMIHTEQQDEPTIRLHIASMYDAPLRNQYIGYLMSFLGLIQKYKIHDVACSYSAEKKCIEVSGYTIINGKRFKVILTVGKKIQNPAPQ